MHASPSFKLLKTLLATLLLASPLAAAERGFVELFDGKSLAGWQFVGPKEKEGSYTVRDGMLVCLPGARGNLFTTQEFSDFVLRFEFRLAPGANNGIGIRAPLDGHPSYDGMEIQVLDHFHPKYAELKPWQYHGSVYGVVAAKREGLKRAGEWNTEEISCIGSRIKVTVNGAVIVDADLSKVTDPKILEKHAGLKRTRGHIGLLGHDDPVEFRNIRVRDLAANGR